MSLETRTLFKNDHLPKLRKVAEDGNVGYEKQELVNSWMVTSVRMVLTCVGQLWVVCRTPEVDLAISLRKGVELRQCERCNGEESCCELEHCDV